MTILLRSALMLCVGLVLGDNYNYFNYPPDSYPDMTPGPGQPVWLIGSNVTLTWATNIDSYNITLWQQNEHEDRAGPVTWASIYTKNPGDPEIGSDGFNWTVQTYNLDATDPDPVGSPIFFLAGGESLNQPGAPGFVSYYVNFTDDPNAPGLSKVSTSGTLSASMTTTSGSINTASSMATATLAAAPVNGAVPTNAASAATPTSTSTSQSTSAGGITDNGLAQGAKAGIGVACGVGIPIVVLLAWLAFRREVRSRQLAKEASGHGREDGPPAYSTPNGRMSCAAKEVPGASIAEASGESVRHELGEGARVELPV